MNYSKIPKIVKKVLPSVVSITVSKELQQSKSPLGLKQKPSQKPNQQDQQIGGGSGFVVDESGIVFTNRHVITHSGAKYVVVFEDEREFKAEILARDPINDMGILKINAEDGLPTAELGDSSDLQLGETVIAIGNALGRFSNTISTGVISGLSRSIKAQKPQSLRNQRLKNLVQTDAAVNPGNSGGPLVNLDGQAIGINAAMVHGAENIGFALPINSVKQDLKEVKQHGKIKRPFLGVRYVPIVEALNKRYDLPVDNGAIVVPEENEPAVVSDSPADQAGLKQGDIILKCNGKEINSEQPLMNLLHQCKIGEPVTFTVFRNGEERELKITLNERK